MLFMCTRWFLFVHAVLGGDSVKSCTGTCPTHGIKPQVNIVHVWSHGVMSCFCGDWDVEWGMPMLQWMRVVVEFPPGSCQGVLAVGKASLSCLVSCYLVLCCFCCLVPCGLWLWCLWHVFVHVLGPRWQG